ncbi:vitellogenin 3, phosvitinless isoform X2 [Brachyhypopomus gauderio]|uniref:vitellogenin 3, phosvitinless isoform X2 n=1 Tax=Brachyhypopomus gauderio TaxID=698409 RepID=UPI00404317B3
MWAEAVSALAMFWLLFCLFVAFAASESINYEPTLNPKKTYEYKYVGMVNIGRDMPDLAESGIKLQCTFKITGVSMQTFLLGVSNVAFEEFNGLPGESSFRPAPNLTKHLAAELTRPFTFEYTKGQVSDIKAAPEVSNTIVNIVRGILGFLHVTIKTTHQAYELFEAGIHGVCQSSYAIEENATAEELYVTQVVDIANCQQKVAIYDGMALAEENKISKERGKNVVATVKYAYTVKSTGSGGLITKASAHERHHFSPFNVKGGTSKLQATRHIVLLKEMETVGKPVTGQVRSKGDLMYQVVKGLGPMPILMIDLTTPLPKIIDLIKHLAQDNIHQLNGATSARVLNLIQLLRATTQEDLELLWKQLSTNNEHRRWFLDTVVEVTDERVLKFLLNRFKATDISANEAGQTLLLAFSHLSAKLELVEMAKEFLTLPFSKSNILLWNTVVLSYGSLVYRACPRVNPCPVVIVQPLLDMATNGLAKGISGEMVLALKALGNAGHLLSIKTIMKFLPGFSVKADTLPINVQSAAVQALRHLAIRDPHNVQDIALTIFAQRTIPAKIRMLASIILLETKPPVAVISLVTELLLHEMDLQVSSFVYSRLRGLAMSRTPDNHYLSTSCNIAVKILAQKLGRLSYRYSQALRLDWFHDDLLTGASGEFFILRNGTDAIPTSIISKGRLYFIGRILQLVELGVHAEGLHDLFKDRNGKEFGAIDVATIMRIVSKWQSLPKDKPLLSVYARVFGQEVSFVDLNQNVIQKILKSVSIMSSKENKVWNIIQNLQKGISWHWTKSFLTFETRFIQPTCLGLPAEFSKYYISLTAITVNAKAEINPPPKEQLHELTTADIFLETGGFAGSAKDFIAFHGISTDLFQCGAQLNSKVIMSVPWKIGFKKNTKENNYEINLAPPKKDTELLTVDFNIYAVSRNIEDPSLTKMTPMTPVRKDSEESLSMETEDNDDSIDDEEKSTAIYHPKLKYCAEASVYGMAMCTELEVQRVHYLKEYPLYYLLGYTHFTFQIQPVKTVKPVEKIRIRICGGHHKHPAEHSQLMVTTHKTNKDSKGMLSSSQENQGLEITPDPVLTVEVLALGPSRKPQGYKSAAYYTPSTHVDDIELIISEVGEEANWKICADANIDKIQSGAKAHFKWGAECQTYEVAVKVCTVGRTGPKPSITTELNWGSVPVFIQMVGHRIGEYLPGVSYVMGFYQKHETNSEQQVSATLSSTQEGFDVKVKIPELTIYRHGISPPFEFMGIESNMSQIIN